MGDTPHTHYDVMGVAEDCDADVLKVVYRKLARKHHPDVGGDPDLFAAVGHAFEVLSDPDARSRYDLDLRAARRATTPSSASGHTWGGAAQTPPGAPYSTYSAQPGYESDAARPEPAWAPTAQTAPAADPAPAATPRRRDETAPVAAAAVTAGLAARFTVPGLWGGDGLPSGFGWVAALLGAFVMFHAAQTLLRHRRDLGLLTPRATAAIGAGWGLVVFLTGLFAGTHDSGLIPALAGTVVNAHVLPNLGPLAFVGIVAAGVVAHLRAQDPAPSAVSVARAAALAVARQAWVLVRRLAARAWSMFLLLASLVLRD